MDGWMDRWEGWGGGGGKKEEVSAHYPPPPPPPPPLSEISASMIFQFQGAKKKRNKFVRLINLNPLLPLLILFL